MSVGKHVPPVFAVDAIEVGRVVVVPDAHFVRPHLFGGFVHSVGGLLQQIGRLVDLRRKRTDDQVPVANRLVELDVAASLSPCSSSSRW